MVPITVMMVASIMMVEAAGSVDESNMTRLDGMFHTYTYRSYKNTAYGEILKGVK